MDVLKKFGERVRELRKERDISQEQLAFKAELHRTYISSIERDCHMPKCFNRPLFSQIFFF